MLMQYLSLLSVGMTTLWPPVVAVKTVVTNDQMIQYINNDHLGLAQSNAPVFFFGNGGSAGFSPCLPTWAYTDSPETGPDIYDSAHRTKPAPRLQWEEVGGDCRTPPFPINQAAGRFPVYYTVNQCNANEIRVVYNLFYEKDGFKYGRLVDVGHDWDWERVVVVFSKSYQPTETWTASNIFYSAHAGYYKYAWEAINSTLTTEQAESANPQQPVELRNEDHPKVYCGWAKHANFDTKYTPNPLAGEQITGLEFRSDDWWWYVQPEDYIEANGASVPGLAMTNQEGGWGHATSIPPTVEQAICGEALTADSPDGFSPISDARLVDQSSRGLTQKTFDDADA